MQLHTMTSMSLYHNEDREPALLVHRHCDNGATLQFLHPYKEDGSVTLTLTPGEMSSFQTFIDTMRTCRNSLDGPTLTIGELETGRLVCRLTSNCDPYRVLVEFEVYMPDSQWEECLTQHFLQSSF